MGEPANGLNGGLYVSRFVMGIVGSLMLMVTSAVAANLWSLNRTMILVEQHLDWVQSPTATLPGAVSEAEFRNYQTLMQVQFDAFTARLEDRFDRLEGAMRDRSD